MSAAEPKRAITDIPEAADISRLLGEVTGVPSPPSPPRGSGPSGSLPSPAKPGEGRDEPSPPSPLPQSRETGKESPAAPAKREKDVVPIGMLAVADFFALVNWKNRPEDAKPLPEVAPVRPPGHEWTVEAVMSAFFGD